MKRLKYAVFVLTMAVIVLWLGGFFFKKEKAGEVAKEGKLVEGIRTERVEVVDTLYTPYTGTVVADKRAEISTRLMGRVRQVLVKEGQYVKEGQLLVVIDAQDIQAQVSAVEKQVEQARHAYSSALANYEAVRKTYERYSALLRDGAITQQEFDQIKAQFESAKAQVEQARAGVQALENQKQAVSTNINYARLTAPFAGYVVFKNVDTGDLAVPGHPLLVIETGPYLFEAFLPERFAGSVKVGQEYQVMVPSLNKSLKGRVVEVSPSIDPATKTFRVKLLLEKAEGLKSGMYANLLLPERVKALLVPERAVVKRFDFTGVWVVKPDSTLELRFIKLGEVRGDKVEVLSGLKEGEQVVVEGLEKACEGCKVGGR